MKNRDTPKNERVFSVVSQPIPDTSAEDVEPFDRALWELWRRIETYYHGDDDLAGPEGRIRQLQKAWRIGESLTEVEALTVDGEFAELVIYKLRIGLVKADRFLTFYRSVPFNEECAKCEHKNESKQLTFFVMNWIWRNHHPSRPWVRFCGGI